jgi:uncharacterized protein
MGAMNVAVLAPPNEVQTLVRVLGLLKDLGIPAFGLKIRDGWDRLGGEGLSSRIERASHVLILADSTVANRPWFHFAAGFCLGKPIRFAIYRLEGSWDPPAFLAKALVLDGVTELEEYYRIEQGEWSLLEERRVARSSLLEIGISFHADSLSHCVSDGDLRAVELFLKAGFTPNLRDKHGVPLLCLAARAKHRGVAELLLEFGATLDLQSEDRGYSALMDATLASAPELVSLFLDHGADPDLQSKDGQTALVVAVGRNDLEITRRLLEAGADPDIAVKLGFSARKYVSLFRKPELLALFESMPAGGQAPSATS